MYRIKFDNEHPDEIINADEFVIDDGWLFFTKDRSHVATVRDYNVLLVATEDTRPAVRAWQDGQPVEVNR
jgi:hypothetical protein